MAIEGQTQSDSHGNPAAAATHADTGAGPRHGSSRMLESYLGDIELLMREGYWDAAAPLALALPHICAALAHADLVSSREAYRAWCETWVRPPQDDTSVTAPSPADLDRLAVERGVEPDLADRPGVPAHALRRLRLRRLSRAAPPRRGGILPAADDAAGEAIREACMALIDAVQRWYDECAARDAAVQSNLARLAVLR
jgi:hypothetical protein